MAIKGYEKDKERKRESHQRGEKQVKLIGWDWLTKKKGGRAADNQSAAAFGCNKSRIGSVKE